jgi:peptide/nickel transport system substrate-binding protein
MSGYWEQVTRRRMSRRAVIVGGAAVGAGLAAVSMAGCKSGGGGGGSSKAAVDQSGLLSFPVDTTSQAKPGGTFKSFLTTDVVSWDPLSSSSFNTQSSVAYYTYPRMLRFTVAKYPARATGASEGDLAEKFELSDDKLQITFKLRQGLKWEQKAPTNGREIDAQDVVFSWNKFAKVSPFRGDFAYSDTNPSAPVESVSAPDNHTVVFKLKQPDASIVQLFTTAILFFVMPRESDGGFDPKGEARGYGPFILDEYKPSTLITWKKNPDYYVKGRPFYDKVELPIIPEYASYLSQFKAGNIWVTVARQEDVVQVKKDIPALLLRQSETFATTPSFFSFGYEENSPFKDQRVRQAVSMLIDRELMADAINGRDKFVKEGLTVPTRYHTVVGAGWDGFWIDPQDSKTFGPNAKYLITDVAEAKKLLSAAGFPNGFETNLFYNGGQQYGSAYTNVANIIPGMLSEGGIKVKQSPHDYQTDYLPNYYYAYAAGKTTGFNGIIWGAERGYPTVASQIFATMHKDGPRFHGMTPDGKEAWKGDPKVNSMIEQIRTEFDLKKQQSLVQDFIRYMTGQAYNIPYPVDTLGFGAYWPVIGNLGVLRTYAGGNGVVETAGASWWIDTSKPPLAKAS